MKRHKKQLSFLNGGGFGDIKAGVETIKKSSSAIYVSDKFSTVGYAIIYAITFFKKKVYMNDVLNVFLEKFRKGLFIKRMRYYDSPPRISRTSS